MPVITIGNAKGGVSKSTLTVAMAFQLREAGEMVAVLDADPKSDSFGPLNGAEPPIAAAHGIDESNILEMLEKVQQHYSWVLVDLPGLATQATLMAFSQSDFVVIPAKPSLPDIRAAMETWKAVTGAEKMTRRSIPRRVLWTQVSPAIVSKVERDLRTDLRERGCEAFRSSLVERTAFRQMMFDRQPVSMIDKTGKAAQNIVDILDEITSVLTEKSKPRLIPSNETLELRVVA